MSLKYDEFFEGFNFELIRSASLHYAPTRTVIVSVSVSPDPQTGGPMVERRVTGAPLVRSEIVDQYFLSSPRDPRPRVSPNHREMSRFGWSYQGRLARETFLVNTSDDGLVAADFAFSSSNLSWSVAMATWPNRGEGDDVHRLADVFAELEVSARAKASRTFKKQWS